MDPHPKYPQKAAPQFQAEFCLGSLEMAQGCVLFQCQRLFSCFPDGVQGVATARGDLLVDFVAIINSCKILRL